MVGTSFSVGTSKKLKQKDKLLLGNLGMQTKVNQVIADEKSRSCQTASKDANEVGSQSKENLNSPTAL